MRIHRLFTRNAETTDQRRKSEKTVRKAVLAITVCGLIAAAIGVGFAQDPFSSNRFPDSSNRFSDRDQPRYEPSTTQRKFNYFSRAGQRDEDQIADKRTETPTRRETIRQFGYTPQPKRYMRKPNSTLTPPTSKSKPPLKNYHRALFGTPPRATTRLQPASQRPTQRPGARSIDSRVPNESAIIPAGFDRQRRLPDPRTASDPQFEQQAPRPPVISADYERRQSSFERDNIRQIRATDKQQLSPFKKPSEIAKTSASKNEPRRPTNALPKLPDPPAEDPKVVAPKNTGLRLSAPKLRSPRLPAAALSPKLPVQPAVQPIPVSPPRVIAAPKANFSQATPVVTLKWVQRGPINVGQKCRCDLVVKNASSVPAKSVEITAFFPNTIRLASTKPAPVQATNHLVWTFPALAAGEEKTIEIIMIPSRRGEIATTANVRFTGTSSAAFQVEEPMLKVAMKGPQEVMVGDPASQVVTISNPGTGIAENVTLEVHLPKGLEHIRGERLLMEVGSLNPGETRSVRLSLAAVSGGTHTVKVEVKGGAALSQTAASQVNVIAPSLKVAVDGPGLRYLGRNASYTISVSNDGQVATNNVRVSHKVADGFGFVSADRGGKFDPATGTVNWFVGRLEANQQTQLKVRLTAKKLGNFQQFVQASSEHGAQAQAKAKTVIDGSASLILEIVDLDDPVEVGAETAYEIRVRNSGTKAAQNVGLSCELPNGVALISAKGTVKHIAEGGMIIFKALPILAPGKTALFRVHVRGSQPGNKRFRTRLTSDSVQEPLVVEELTKFYAD